MSGLSDPREGWFMKQDPKEYAVIGINRQPQHDIETFKVRTDLTRIEANIQADKLKKEYQTVKVYREVLPAY